MQPSSLKNSTNEVSSLASSEEQAIAAINAAEALAISNVQLIRELKKILPKPFNQLTELAVQTNTQGIQAVAAGERAVVKKVSKKARTSRKNLSKALREANSKLRLKNGKLRKGKTQQDVMRLAQKLRRKM
jgi:hypothetical protein